MGSLINITEIANEQIFLPKLGYWDYYPESDRLVISERSAQISGFDAEVMTLGDLADLVINKDRDVFDQFVSKLRSEKTYLGVEFRIRFKPGAKAKWLSCYAEHKQDNGEERYTGHYVNITNKKQKEQKLSISNSNFEKIEGISRMGSFNWILSESYLLCSDNFFNLTRCKNRHPENKLGKDVFFNLINRESRQFVSEVIEEGISTNQRFEVSFRLAKQPDIKLKLFGYPLGDEHEKKFFGLIQDISYSGDSRNSLIEGQDTERKRISLELHDSVGQKLIAVKYKLALMKMKKDLNELEYVNKSIDEIIDEVRAITHNLSSQIVNEVGLKEAVNQILSETADALSANKHFEYNVEENKLNVDSEKMIYRIIQESLSNALKHSKAKNLTVKLKMINHQISIVISDDGIGFENEFNSNRGIGLQNIKERVTYLNGFFKLISEKGKGTTIRVKIPLSR